MLANNRILGSTNVGASFADIITNNISAVADNQVSGFEGFLHDPKLLKETVEYIGKMPVPKRFIEAVTARRVATASINSTWRCPLNLQTPLTCPIPWILVESNQATSTNDKFEYQIMRTADFIGRNYVRIELPEVDTSTIAMKYKNGKLPDPMTDPDQMYLGAWHRDLVPRIIQQVEFYPRSSQHRLFVYTGYDIAVHNIIFGNANKEMNDLMAGEDKFELAYDPYRVDGTALGIASFKGIDTFKEYKLDATKNSTAYPAGTTNSRVPTTTYGIAYTGVTTTTVPTSGVFEHIDGETDGFVDTFQLDTTMDDEEFKNYYRRNVWYEAPVAVPYDCRHSIHSRRFFHRKAVIIIPLDVLPFGYSIEASLPASALAGDCGFISIQKYSDWFDRAFYLTRLSDVPSLHPLVQHRHFAKGDMVAQKIVYNNDLVDGWGLIGDPVGTTSDGATPDPRNGWVNPRSIGRYGDVDFMSAEINIADGKYTTDNPVPYGPNDKQAPILQEGAVIGKPAAGLEGVIPTINQPIVTTTEGQSTTTTTNYATQYMPKHQAYGGQTLNSLKTFSRVPTSMNASAANRLDRNLVGDPTLENVFLHRPSDIDKSWYASHNSDIRIKLIQTAYIVLPCIKQLLTRLPNIYITTEWDDSDIDISSREFKITNDLYIMAILLWFLPKDSNDVESLRVYPHHKKDTEYPLVAGIHLQNEQSQGQNLMSWDMMNLMEPAHMGLAPLLSNMGIISFTPLMKPNTLPFGIYDQNLSGYLIGKFEKGDDSNIYEGNVNMRSGIVKAISIGINGVAVVNLSLYRLVF